MNFLNLSYRNNFYKKILINGPIKGFSFNHKPNIYSLKGGVYVKIDLIGGALFFESEQSWTSKSSTLPEQIFKADFPTGRGNKSEAYDDLAKKLAESYERK